MNARRIVGPGARVAELREGLLELGKAARASDEKTRGKVTKEIEKTLNELRRLRDDVDPVSTPTAFLDPTYPLLIANFIGIALLAQPRRTLEKISEFHGSGVYAIYYEGKNKWYRPLSGTEHPIYIGKAAPMNFRAARPRDQGRSIYKRLKQHAGTIESGSGIKLSDFSFRFLVVHSGWELSAEEFLVDMFKPVWNEVADGFGNHQPGGGRPGKKLSAWDALHPGRSWVRSIRSKKRRRQEEVLVALREHLGGAHLFKTRRQIMKQFFGNLEEWKIIPATR